LASDRTVRTIARAAFKLRQGDRSRIAPSSPCSGGSCRLTRSDARAIRVRRERSCSATETHAAGQNGTRPAETPTSAHHSVLINEQRCLSAAGGGGVARRPRPGRRRDQPGRDAGLPPECGAVHSVGPSSDCPQVEFRSDTLRICQDGAHTTSIATRLKNGKGASLSLVAKQLIDRPCGSRSGPHRKPLSQPSKELSCAASRSPSPAQCPRQLSCQWGPISSRPLIATGRTAFSRGPIGCGS